MIITWQTTTDITTIFCRTKLTTCFPRISVRRGDHILAATRTGCLRRLQRRCLGTFSSFRSVGSSLYTFADRWPLSSSSHFRSPYSQRSNTSNSCARMILFCLQRSLWLVLEVALAIDYALFLLSRFSEEFESRRAKRAAGRRRLRSGATVDIFPDTCTEDSSNAKEPVVAVCLTSTIFTPTASLAFGRPLKLRGKRSRSRDLPCRIVRGYDLCRRYECSGRRSFLRHCDPRHCSVQHDDRAVSVTPDASAPAVLHKIRTKVRLLRKAICSRIVTHVRICCTSFRGQIAHLPITGSTSSTSRARSVSMQPMMTNGDVGRGTPSMERRKW